MISAAWCLIAVLTGALSVSEFYRRLTVQKLREARNQHADFLLNEHQMVCWQHGQLEDEIKRLQHQVNLLKTSMPATSSDSANS